MKLLLLAAMAMAVAACSGLPVYSHYEHIDGDGWRRDDTVTFTTVVRDSANYHLVLGLRATDAYPYTQLTVNVDVNENENENEKLSPYTSHLTPPTSHLPPPTSRPLTVDITDAKGELLGKGNALCQYEVSLGDVVIGRGDTLTVHVAHAMSRFSLPGITDVGLTVER